MKTIVLITIIVCSTFAFSQNTTEYRIEQLYEKVDLKYGTLDENGRNIEHIFVETEMNVGKFEIILLKSDGDLYQIKGTDYYIKFSSYYGYIGYSGDEGILVIGSSMYNSSFIKFE